MQPQYDQVRSASAAAAARSRLRSPSYASAAAVGVIGGVILALGSMLADLIPGLMPQRPVTLARGAVAVLTGAAAGLMVALIATAIVRATRLALYRSRTGDRAA